VKVLVINDEPTFRMIVDTVLRRQGYEVLRADTGKNGLAVYRREHPHVVVFDLTIPERDGVAILHQIRHMNAEQSVIVLAGDRSPEPEREVRALGVSEWIVKGPSLHSLIDTLTCLLASRSHAA